MTKDGDNKDFKYLSSFPPRIFQYMLCGQMKNSDVSNDHSLLNCHYGDRFSSWECSFYFYAVLNILLGLFVQKNILSDLLFRKCQ